MLVERQTLGDLLKVLKSTSFYNGARSQKYHKSTRLKLNIMFLLFHQQSRKVSLVSSGHNKRARLH